MKSMRIFGMLVIAGLFVFKVFQEAGPWTGLAVAALFFLQLTADSCTERLIECCRALIEAVEGVERDLYSHIDGHL